MSRTLIVLLVAVITAGCGSKLDGWPPSHEEPRDIVVAGGHIRWTGESTAELEAYFVNTDPNKTEFVFEASAFLYPSGNGAPGIAADSFRNGTSWPLGETRQMNIEFERLNASAYRGRIGFSDLDNIRAWDYATTCVDRNHQVVSSCPDATFNFRYETDSNEYERLAACCNWKPPQVDLHSLRCNPLGPDIVCEVAAWDYTNQTAIATAHAILSFASGNPQETIVDLGGALSPGETRILTFSFPGAFTEGIERQELNPRVTISACQVDFPRACSSVEGPVSVTDRPIAGAQPEYGRAMLVITAHPVAEDE